MKAVVLGSGIIGVCTAYYLAQQGAEVTVIEQEPQPAMGTSFANAGQISPAYSTPLAAPGVALKLIKWMMQQHSPFSIKPDGSWFQLQWLLATWHNCNIEKYAVNKERMLRLAEYSRDCLIQLRQQTNIEYEGLQKGTIQLFRSAQQLDAAQKDIEILQKAGVAYELLNQQQLSLLEPALAPHQQIKGALRLPNDETGDCHLFTNNLAKLAQQLGVKFLYNTKVTEFVCQDDNKNKLTAVKLGEHLIKADAYVVALGIYSRDLLAQLKIDLPVYPLKGYSLTIPITDASKAPVSTVIDETYKIAITRFANRIRVGGMAEIVGYNSQLKPQRRATLEIVLNDLFPNSGELAQASFWTGLRPMTPDSTPIVGATKYTNLFLNTGHGMLGWTMGCGSGKLLADIIFQKTPDIAYADLALARY